MVSAVCPLCKILLVEATDNSYANLAIAVNYASAHANYVSNSYGGSESSFSTGFAASYNHPGVLITVSSGDSGFAAGPQSPASYASVVSVGGTSLIRNSSARGFKEKAWSGAGSGCSNLIAKPAWQTAATQCAKRAIADISAVADPATGVTVYDTYATGGFAVFGGTSASAPIIAAAYALAGTGPTSNGASGIWAAAATKLFDVKVGSNGSCGGVPMCTAGAGWDGPTGRGAPKGVGALR
jgi:subtilase family serine protease